MACLLYHAYFYVYHYLKYQLLIIFFSFLLLFCFCIYAIIIRLVWNKAFTIIGFLVFFPTFTTMSSSLNCSKRQFWLSLIIGSEKKLSLSLFIGSERKLFSLLFLPMNVGLGVALDSGILSTLHCSHTSTSCLLFVQLSDFTPSAWTVFFTSTSWLLFVQLSHFLSSVWTALSLWQFHSAFCMDYHLVSPTCLLFHSLLLVHPEYLYLTCLTMLGSLLELQNFTYLLFFFMK